MLLSVIIPVFNVESFLEECLDSVYSQDLREVEVICVNDGSTDNSRAILKKYKDKHVDLLIHDRLNGGLSAARNSGLSLASGEYIYFFDSDDVLLPGAIKLITSFIIDKSVDIACFNSLVGSNELYFYKKEGFDETYTGKEYYLNFQKKNNFFPPSAVWMYVFSSKLLNSFKLSFREGILHEDEHFTPRVFYLATRVKLLDIPILYHRVAREGSIMQKVRLKNLIDLQSVCLDLFNFFKKNKETEKLYYHKIFELYFDIANKIVANGYIKEKNEILKKTDFELMKSCAISWDYYVYYWLFRYNTRLFNWYISDKSSALIKKMINKIFKLYYK